MVLSYGAWNGFDLRGMLREALQCCSAGLLHELLGRPMIIRFRFSRIRARSSSVSTTLRASSGEGILVLNPFSTASSQRSCVSACSSASSTVGAHTTKMHTFVFGLASRGEAAGRGFLQGVGLRRRGGRGRIVLSTEKKARQSEIAVWNGDRRYAAQAERGERSLGQRDTGRCEGSASWWSRGADKGTWDDTTPAGSPNLPSTSSSCHQRAASAAIRTTARDRSRHPWTALDRRGCNRGGGFLQTRGHLRHVHGRCRLQ